MNERSPSPQFIQSLFNSLKYWQKQTHRLDPQRVAELDEKRANLFQAVTIGLQVPETWRDTTLVVLQSFDFVEWRGYSQEWIPVMAQALATAPAEELALRGRLLNRLGHLYRETSDFARAIEMHKKAVALSQEVEDDLLLGSSLQSLSEAYLRNRQYEPAETYGQRALTAVAHIKDPGRLRAGILNTLGEIARARGDLPLAQERLSQAVAFYRSLDDPVYLARSLNDLANTHQAAAAYTAAQACYREAATILSSLADEVDKAKVQMNLGVLHYRQEEWTEAEAAFRQIDLLALKQAGQFDSQALVLNNLGNVLLKQDRLTEAEKYLREAITLWRTLEEAVHLANTLGTLAELLAKQEQTETAVSLYQEAIELLRPHPDDAWAQKLYKNFQYRLSLLA